MKIRFGMFDLRRMFDRQVICLKRPDINTQVDVNLMVNVMESCVLGLLEDSIHHWSGIGCGLARFLEEYVFCCSKKA